MLSAFLILAAIAWMQNPVDYRLITVTDRAEMTKFWAILTNPILVATIVHTLFAALVTAGMFVIGVSAYHLLRRNEVELFRRAAGIAMVVTFVCALGVAFSGHAQAQVMTRVQPMKMAAAEALYTTERGASFSLLTIGNLSGRPILQIRVPHLLSVLATNNWNGIVRGIDDVQASEQATHGPGNYAPVLWVTYWMFRIMVGTGFLMIFLTGLGLVEMRRHRMEVSRRFLWVMLPALALPYIANSSGWIFTEMGRQPWVVYGLLRTRDAVSSTVGAGYVAMTLIGFTLLYAALAAVDVWLMARYAKSGPGVDNDHAPQAGRDAGAQPALVY